MAKEEIASNGKKKDKPFYRPGDVRGDYSEDLGDPGQFPFTRGIHPEMYRTRLWTMRQYAGYATAEESNKRYRYLLEQGNTGLSVAFDLPTQIGYDSDHVLAEGEVGRVGVAVDSIRDMQILFDGINIADISTSMTINATASILLALYSVVAEAQGAEASMLSGTIQNDILKEYVARGTYIYPPEPSMRLVTDLFAFCSKRMPRWNTISISGYHIREAGATAVQEVAFTFANAIAYCDAAVSAGLEFDDFAPRLSFFFNVHNDFFEEAAKFRAARRLWARIAEERFGGKNPKSKMMRFHTQTAGSTLTAQQPENNVVRTTMQALAAVLGGTQSLHTNAMDEALALPTEESVRLALRTQQVIAHESGAATVADPLGGSWYIEKLTNEIEEEVRNYIERIDYMGGAVAAIESGFIQSEIASSAYKYQKRVEDGTQLVVGMNAFKSEPDPEIETFEVDPTVAQRQVERLDDLRKTRDESKVNAALDGLAAAAEGTENTMPTITDCVRAQATLGEISDRLREVFGEYDR